MRHGPATSYSLRPAELRIAATRFATVASMLEIQAQAIEEQGQGIPTGEGDKPKRYKRGMPGWTPTAGSRDEWQRFLNSRSASSSG